MEVGKDVRALLWVWSKYTWCLTSTETRRGGRGSGGGGKCSCTPLGLKRQSNIQTIRARCLFAVCYRNRQSSANL